MISVCGQLLFFTNLTCFIAGSRSSNIFCCCHWYTVAASYIQNMILWCHVYCRVCGDGWFFGAGILASSTQTEFLFYSL